MNAVVYPQLNVRSRNLFIILLSTVHQSMKKQHRTMEHSGKEKVVGNEIIL